jgi:hypothetical protein
VPNQEETSWYWTIEWTPRNDTLRFSRGEGGYLVPLLNVKSPIISITELQKNDEDYADTPDWISLTEGPADNSSFLLLTSGLKNLGYAIWFYDNLPMAGPKRLRVTYTYGYNVDNEILQRWCTLKVAIKVLVAKMGTSSASGLTELQGEGLGIYLPRQYKRRIDELKAEVAIIEKTYFPKPSGIPAAIFGA